MEEVVKMMEEAQEWGVEVVVLSAVVVWVRW
jgi:hypothetical protein